MLYTASLNRKADQRGLVLDVTVKSAAEADRCLAPTWDLVMGAKRGELDWAAYTEGYLALLRGRWRDDPAARARLEALADRACAGDVTLCCYCRGPERCHRSLLAAVLVKVAAGRGRVLRTRVA